MTPAEHYSEAERILVDVVPIWNEFKAMSPEVRTDGLPEILAALEFAMSRAQVHATLATCKHRPV